MPFKFSASLLLVWAVLICSAYAVPNQFPESPNFTNLTEPGFFAGLVVGDSREIVLQKLQDKGFLGYTELQSNLIKSPVRWDGHAYELTCKFEGDGLSLCLIQGEAGWQDFFYDDIVQPQWSSLRKRVIEIYGLPAQTVAFPPFYKVPLNDEGGLVTDRWELEDRILILCLHAYSKQDCCTRQVLDFSCCTLLIQPK
jgi:hypothetical protein